MTDHSDSTATYETSQQALYRERLALMPAEERMHLQAASATWTPPAPVQAAVAMRDACTDIERAVLEPVGPVGSVPPSEGVFDVAARSWAVANVERAMEALPRRRHCGHDAFEPDCTDCAFERGRTVGHIEAGAYRLPGE